MKDLKDLSPWYYHTYGDSFELIGWDTTFIQDLVLISDFNLLHNPNANGVLDWSSVKTKYKFDYKKLSEVEVTDLLKQSRIKESTGLITFFDDNEPLVRLPAALFMHEWKELHKAKEWGNLFLIDPINKIVIEIRDLQEGLMFSNFPIGSW